MKVQMVRLTGATARNTHYPDKPNEDAYWYDEGHGLAIVLDGVSRSRENGVYPNPSPAKQATEVFLETVKYALQNHVYISPCAALDEAIVKGNSAIARMNVSAITRGRHAYCEFLPGTVGIVAYFIGSYVAFFYIGDCNAIHISDGKLHMLTEPQTRQVHLHKNEFSTREIRSLLVNDKHHPCGYGVWNGMEEAKDFTRLCELSMKAGDKLLLCTDGIEPFLASLSEKELAAMDSKTLLDTAMAYVKPEGYMDDRTLIVAEVYEVEKN